MPLYDFIINQPHLDAFELGWVNLPALLDRIHDCEQAAVPLGDEQVLTFLCAYAYCLEPNGPQELARVLLQDENVNYPGQVWFEFLPVSCRENEGATHLDLALGHVHQRPHTVSGIEYLPPAVPSCPSWLAVVEAKLLSDISCGVTYDPFRNQLLRVIETAATLQNGQGALPEAAHVVLLTPKVFREHRRARFYGCKYDEYCQPQADPAVGAVRNVDAILDDLNRLQLHAVYNQDIIEWGLQSLKLHWVTYQEVILGAPPSPFRNDLLALVNREGSLVAVPG